MIGALVTRVRGGSVERALYQGVFVSAVIAAAAFLPIMDDGQPHHQGCERRRAFDRRSVALHADRPVITGLIFVITDFYTSTRFRPVKTIAHASVTGHATNIIQGLAQGLQSTAAPALLIAGGILGANELAGIYGIGVAVMAQLSMTGLIVALDAFGRSPTTQAASRRWRTCPRKCVP